MIACATMRTLRLISTTAGALFMRLSTSLADPTKDASCVLNLALPVVQISARLHCYPVLAKDASCDASRCR
jgi:hypothetical protein